MILTSECTFAETFNSDDTTFRKSRRRDNPSSSTRTGDGEGEPAPVPVRRTLSGTNNNSNSSSSSRSGFVSRKGKKSRSLLQRISWNVYVPLLVLAGAVQYFGGVNEVVVELMSYYYRYYGFLNVMFFGSEYVLVDTTYGKLRGFTTTSREGKTFYEFLGVPYATPPTTPELRFQPPVPPEKWDGVRDATGYGDVCYQYDLFLQSIAGQEDCLTLNIYTPKVADGNVTDGNPLPVLVFIHGGMYMFGRALDFRGDHFMDQDVVVVTINYRLNIFGFLNTGDGIIRGNMGLKDQVLALRYVRDNIAYFGGDPNLVTIWGESAGGASVQLHTLSPMSEGLFHRAIASSGFALAHWSFTRTPKEQAKIFAKKVDCPTRTTEEMVECLKTISGRKIAEVFRGTHDVLHPRLDVFTPTIESGFPNENDTETFLAEHPRDILRRGDIRTRVPMMSGVNAEEGLIYAGYFIRNETVSSQLNADWLKFGPILADYESLPKWDRDAVSKRIWNYYLGNQTMGMDTLYEVVDLFSDVSFNKPMTESSLLLSKKLPLYLYIYSHRGEFGVAQIYFRLSLKFPILVDGLLMNAVSFFKRVLFGIHEKHWGTCHADEQAIFFKMHPLLATINPGHREFEFSRELVRIWASFARNGKPDGYQGRHWEQAFPDRPAKFMKLTDESEPGMTYPPWTHRLQFLNSLPGFQCMDSNLRNITGEFDRTSLCF